MVLNYLGKPTGEDRLMSLLRVQPDLGAAASNIKRLVALGVAVTYTSGTLDDLNHQLEQGLPCVAFVDTLHLGYWSEATRHAVVVVGIDDESIYLNDPFFAEAPQSVSHLEFELAWDEFDNAYAVIQLIAT